jgi:hypothetical protein
MRHAFQYKPRFKDIRIKPPGDEPKADERTCDWAECAGKGECRAPKGPDQLTEYYWFCKQHAAEYNKNWNFFADMSEDQVRAYQAGAAHGHRPTWSMGNGAVHRETKAKTKAGWGVFGDPFGLFGDKAARETGPRKPKLGRLEERAYETLNLQPEAGAKAVRARYTELVKQFHPDMNGGDRSTEGRLTQVIRAYKTLKKARLA